MKLEYRLTLLVFLVFLLGVAIGSEYHPILTAIAITSMGILGHYMREIFPEIKELK